MPLLYSALTFLVAHLAFFGGLDVHGLLNSALAGAGLQIVFLKYAIAAVLVALFFRVAKLSGRLSFPLRGRGLLWCGTVLFALQALIFYGGLSIYRPGLGMLFIPLIYMTPIAAVLTLTGSLLAMLGLDNGKIRPSET
jgi:hypothetical protein